MIDRNRGEEWFLSVVSKERNGVLAGATRAVLQAVEPIYSAAMIGRNFLYDKQLLTAARAGRPVVSVGNLTTGGTGKTPMVAWVASQLRAAGRRPAVLLRGYKSVDGSSDEQMLLSSMLNLLEPFVPVHAAANRFEGSRAVLAQHAEVDTFVLDDGLQHRRLAREFDLALIDATAPFGFGHVIPRGLLREPVRALQRVDAVTITRASLVEPDVIDEIERRIRGEQADVPVFHVDFPLERLFDSYDRAAPIEVLSGKRFFAFCAIGNPASFIRQLDRSGGERVGFRQFVDHHAYTIEEIDKTVNHAMSAGADFIVTTEKDFVKIARLFAAKSGDARPPIWRAAQSVQFRGDGANRLSQQIFAAVGRAEERAAARK